MSVSESYVPTGLFVCDSEGNPIVPESLEHWLQWMKREENRRVALTRMENAAVSTIFIGADVGDDPEHPVLWETMVQFGQEVGIRRWASLQEARNGHADTVLAFLENGASLT